MMKFLILKNILLVYWAYTICFLFRFPVIAEETPNNFFNDSSLIQTYKQEICQLKDTCNIIDQIPQSLQDLRTRNCMCDNETCNFYGDCCKYGNQTKVDFSMRFVCTQTRFDGAVYMVKSCPDQWNVESIEEKCLAQNSTLPPHDILLKLPVTSTTNGITFANVFCAICNDLTDYDFWNVGFTYEFSGSNNNHSMINAEDILAKLSFNKTGQMIWSSYVNELFYKCYLEAKIPSHIMSLRYCVPDVIRSCQNDEICDGFTSYVYSGDKVYQNLECAKCNDETEFKGCPELKDGKFDENLVEIPIVDSRIPKVPHCHEIPKNTSAHKLLCEENSSGTDQQIEDCFRVRKKSSRLCYINEFYFRSRNDYYYVNNETVFIYEYDMEFPHVEWVALGEDKIYVCGPKILRTKYERIMFSLNEIITEVLIKISIICIILHLLTFWQRPKLRNLSGKNLVSFCIALLTAFILLEIGPWLPSCKIVAIIAHYGFLSCFTWMLVISYDIWLGIYRATAKLCRPNKKNRSKFLIYSMIAWISPVLVVGPAIYAEFSPPHVVSCELKPGYGEFGQCFIAKLKPHLYFFLYPTFVVFVVNISFFAHTAHLIYSSRRGSVNPVKRHDFKVYFRLGILMGLTWTLGLLVALTRSELIGILFTVFNMSQGIFIFFEFTFDKKVIKGFLKCNERANVSEHTQMDSL